MFCKTISANAAKVYSRGVGTNDQFKDSVDQSINQSLFLERQKVDQRAGHLTLPHVGITKTDRNGTKT